jgi:choline kinase
MKSINNTSIWNGKPHRLAILVPTRDMVHTQFAFSLAQLMKTNAELGIETFLFFDSSTILLNQREHLIDKAKEINADYMLWLDSDMVFPSTIATRLLNHKKDIVACNYNKRSLPIKTVAYADISDWDSWVPMLIESGLIKVQGVGMGCMLMKTSIFDKIEKPYFTFSYNKEQNDWLGEDFNLQEKLRNVGYEIFIDTTLSMDIKHMGIQGF